MIVVAPCPTCHKSARFDTTAAPEALDCARCGGRRPVSLSTSIRERNVPDVCALCDNGHFYVERDFNGWIGLGVMTVAIAGFLWTIRTDWFLAMGILGAAAALDFVAYVVSPNRAICYRCLASYRRGAPNPEHKTYDLGIAARFADDYEERRAEHARRDRS